MQYGVGGPGSSGKLGESLTSGSTMRTRTRPGASGGKERAIAIWNCHFQLIEFKAASMGAACVGRTKNSVMGGQLVLGLAIEP